MVTTIRQLSLEHYAGVQGANDQQELGVAGPDGAFIGYFLPAHLVQASEFSVEVRAAVEAGLDQLDQGLSSRWNFDEFMANCNERLRLGNNYTPSPQSA